MKNIYNKAQREYKKIVDERNERLNNISCAMHHYTYFSEGQLDALEDNLESDQIIVDRLKGVKL